MKRKIELVLVATAVLVMFVAVLQQGPAAEPKKQRIYELRTYHVLPGRMPAMLARFRNHTTKLFEKHGMENVGYWTPEGKENETKLIYVLAHDNKEAAERSWKGFRDDETWKKVREASEKDGKIVEKVESVYLKPTDFSQLQ